MIEAFPMTRLMFGFPCCIDDCTWVGESRRKRLIHIGVKHEVKGGIFC